MAYKALYSTEELNKNINANKAALIYFSSPECSVCKVLKPKVEEMIQELFPEIKLFYVDISESPLISGQCRIFSIPTILVFLEGKEFIRKSRNIGLDELAGNLERPYNLLFS
jgi:thioredoxin-like negative regulator of GroEL